MINPRVEEDYGFSRTYSIFDSAKIMYYIVEQYGEKFVDDLTKAAIEEMGAKTEPERKEAEVQAYTEFMRKACPTFKPTRDVRLIRVLMAIVDVRIAQETLLGNHEALKGKITIDSLDLTSYILDGRKVAIKCSNNALDRMAFETKNASNQNDLLNFEHTMHLVIRDLTRMSEYLKNDVTPHDLTYKVRMACREGMLRLNRAKMRLLNIYNNIEMEIEV